VDAELGGELLDPAAGGVGAHVGEDAFVRANLEWSKHPDLH
jgi:hypothetical protein